jgi:zinc protease
MIRNSMPYWILFVACAIAGISGVSPANAAPVPEMSSERLLNGLEVIVAPAEDAGQELAVGLVLRYGSAFDDSGKSGLAHLLSRMFLKATGDKTAEGIRLELENLGATIDIQCDWDGYRFLLRGKSATFERALLLLYQVVCEAQFNDEDLDSEKRELLAELQQAADSRSRVHAMFEKVLFGDTTYGRTLHGTPESVSSLNSGDLRYFYNKYFSPNAASLVIAGAVSPGDVLEKASRIWGLWIRKDPIPFTFAPSREPSEDVHLIDDDPGSSAVEFILGNLSPRRQDPLYGNVRVAAYILQQRLRAVMPTSLLTVRLDSRRMPGSLYVQGQASAEESIDQILKIEESMARMKQETVSPEELADAQNRIIEEFGKGLDTPEGLCKAILDTELYRLGSYYLSSFPDRVRDCNADSVRQAARDYFFPGKKIVILRGPVQELLPDLKRLGAFKKIAP